MRGGRPSAQAREIQYGGLVSGGRATSTQRYEDGQRPDLPGPRHSLRGRRTGHGLGAEQHNAGAPHFLVVLPRHVRALLLEVRRVDDGEEPAEGQLRQGGEHDAHKQRIENYARRQLGFVVVAPYLALVGLVELDAQAL